MLHEVNVDNTKNIKLNENVFNCSIKIAILNKTFNAGLIKEKIKANSDWKYVGIYADEGITGTLDYKRDGFMKMMQDATNNKFDMIITK